MPIPELEVDTGYLPNGDHVASLEEVEERFGKSTYRRRELFKGLLFVVERLKAKGVTEIWVDGSFVSAKERPGDVDVVLRGAGRGRRSLLGVALSAQEKRSEEALPRGSLEASFSTAGATTSR